MSLALFLHILAAVIWVGGMFFAVVVLRPATGALSDADRLMLWETVLTRFFRWVTASIVVILGSGLWIIFSRYGGFGGTPVHVHSMFAFGLLMMLMFGHVFFAPFRRLRRAIAAADIDTANRAIGQIRWFVTGSLAIGVLVLWLASAGRTGIFL